MHLVGLPYHVHNRGCNRESIFRTTDDYSFLIHKAQTFLPNYALHVLAYCLMPNHYHFLLRPEKEDAISRFIQRLFNSYTQRFNSVWQRSGTLFEGRARSTPVESENHLLHLCRYIHLNPVKAGLVKHPGQWPFSNYREWMGWRHSNLYDEDWARTYFATPHEYEVFVTGEIDPVFEQQIQAFCCD